MDTQAQFRAGWVMGGGWWVVLVVVRHYHPTQTPPIHTRPSQPQAQKPRARAWPTRAQRGVAASRLRGPCWCPAPLTIKPANIRRQGRLSQLNAVSLQVCLIRTTWSWARLQRIFGRLSKYHPMRFSSLCLIGCLLVVDLLGALAGKSCLQCVGRSEGGNVQCAKC